MKLLLYLRKFLITILSMILLVVLAISIAYLLPFPWDKVNIIFVIMCILMVARGTGLVVWIIFGTHILIELYTITPFGMTLFAATMSMLFTYWLYQQFFTNRSWYAACALSMISIFFYRLIYSILMLILAVGSDTVEYSWQDFIPMFGWELFLTSVCTGVLYALLSLFFPSFRKNDMRII